MKGNQAINLGIIGMGKVTVQRHIPSIRSIRDPDITILAAADAAPGIAEKTTAEHGIEHAFEDYRRLLEMEEIDAVSICTPTFTHARIAIDALRAGKHVYLEKPAAMNEAEIREIVEAANESGNVFIVGSNGLLQNQMQLFKRMIDNGELGEVFHVGVSRSLARRADDRRRKTIGGDGIGMESASHNVEWALYFLGDPKPVSVTALGYYKFDNLSFPLHRREPGEVEDCTMALIGFDNGSSFMYSAMRAAAAPSKYEVQIQGDLGSIKYDVHKCYREKSDDCIEVFTVHEEGHLVASKPQIVCGKTHRAMYEHFFECIREGKPSPLSNGERSIVVMKVLDALKRSMASGGVRIEL